MDALASLIDHGERIERLASRPPNPELEADGDDEVEPALPSDRPHGSILPWTEASTLLERYDLETVDTRRVQSPDEAVEAFRELSGAVVLKIDSPDVAHRTDLGAIRTDLRTEEDVRRGYQTVVSNVREHEPEARITGVLVQPMVEDGLEVLVGLTQDAVFDSMVTVGTGGTVVETLDDTAHILPPYTKEEAAEALAETHIPELLRNRRGKRAIDVGDLEEYLVRMGDLATELPIELELNPVHVTEDGVRALDVLVSSPPAEPE